MPARLRLLSQSSSLVHAAAMRATDMLYLPAALWLPAVCLLQRSLQPWLPCSSSSRLSSDEL